VDSNRILRPLLWLLILAGGFFGLAAFIAPATFASLTGFAGTDVFTYRLAGAATFAYAIGLVAGTRASWVELRIPIASTLTFNAASIFACALAIASGGAQPLVFVILLASAVFTAGTWQLLRQPPLEAAGKARAELERPIASWLVGLYVIGVAAAAVFGLGRCSWAASSASSPARAATTPLSTARPGPRPWARPSAGSSCCSPGAGPRPDCPR